MRRLIAHPLALAACLALAVSSAPAGAAERPVERTLPNGLRVVVLQRPRLPIVQVQLMVTAGSDRDPAGQAGLAMVTAQMLRRGTSSRTAAAYAAAVDRLGGTVTTQATREYSMVTGAFLARDLEPGLELMSGAVLDPLFADEELQRVRMQSFRQLVQARISPATVADERVWGAAFGEHPFSHPVYGGSRSLGAITQVSLRDFYRDEWRPDHAVLAIAGDVTPETAFALAGDWFGRWEGRAVTAPPVPALAPPAQPRLVLVDLPGLEWAEVRLALVMPGRRAADAAAAALAASAFAGGPGSRLGALRGGIGGAAAHGNLAETGEAGLLVVSLAVPVDSAAAAARRLRAELAAFAKSPPAERELAPLRHALVASFPLGFETLGGALTQWLQAALDGESADQLLGTPARLAALSAGDVAAAVKRWYDPAHAIVLVAGPAARLAAPLAALGTVERQTVEPLTPPGAAVAIASGDTLTAATPERVRRGREAIARALVAHGGAARLRGVADAVMDGDMVLSSGGRDIPGQIEVVRKNPYRMLTDTHVLTMETRQVLDGHQAWFQGDPDSVGTPLDSLAVGVLRAQYGTDLPHLLLAAADSAATVIWRGPSRAGDAPSDAVEVITAAGERRRYHFDTATGRLVAVDLFASTAPDASVMVRHEFSDFRDVSGIQWPFREVRRSPGDNTLRVDVKSVLLNQGVSDVTFLRPIPR